MPTAPESSFSASLTSEFRGKSLDPHWDRGKQPNASASKLVVPRRVLAELCVWLAYRPLEGGEPVQRGTGPGESRHLQTRSP